MQISREGIELIKGFEGCRLDAYQDSKSIWTIGYGHTEGVCRGMSINQAAADEFLRSDLQVAEKGVVARMGKVSLQQNEFDACVSLAYNIGVGAFSKSTLAKYIANELPHTKEELHKEWLKWSNSGGKYSQGLYNRRAIEWSFYCFGKKTEGKS